MKFQDYIQNGKQNHAHPGKPAGKGRGPTGETQLF